MVDAAVGQDVVVGVDHRVPRRRSDELPVLAVHPEDHDPFVRETELRQRLVDQPVVAAGMEFDDPVVVAEPEELREVPGVEGRPSGQRPPGEGRQHPLEHLDPGEDRDRDQAADQRRPPLDGLPGLRVDEPQQQGCDAGDDAGVAEGHEPEDDAAPNGMVDRRLGLGGREPDPHQRGAGLERRGLARHAGADERDRGDTGRGHEQQGDDQERHDGEHWSVFSHRGIPIRRLSGRDAALSRRRERS